MLIARVHPVHLMNVEKMSNTKLVHWSLMDGLLHLVQRGGAWAGPQPAQAPPRCTKCNSPSINGQCTNFILFDVHYNSLCPLKG